MTKYLPFRRIWILVIFSAILCSSPAWAIPTCKITRENPGPPLSVEFTIQDTTIGLWQIFVTESVNAQVNIPVFAPGIINPVIVTATQINPGGAFSVTLEARDLRGGSSVCRYPAQPVDDSPPDCEVSAENPGPPFSVEITVQDTESGLFNIDVLEALNMTVDVPAFSPGTTDPVVVVATVINAGDPFRVTLENEDVAGNLKTCSYPSIPEDNDPPNCEITSEVPGPPFVVKITFRDTVSGLKAIHTIEAINATVSIPAFAPGTTDDIVVTVTQIHTTLEFSVELEAVDLQDNAATCSYPVLSVVGSRPEYDAVGTDSGNVFGDYYKDWVIENSRDRFGNKINNFSDFASENFTESSGILVEDPCFSLPNQTYLTSLTPSWSEGEYSWEITLQMKPASDLFVAIVACILKHGEEDAAESARQTGLFRVPWMPNQLVFTPSANPKVTVQALPGPWATKGFPAGGFYLDGRSLSGLDTVPLVDSLMSLQAFLEEGILAILPQTGVNNSSGQTMYELNAGDRIRVTLIIPFNNTADIRLGSDNVVLKYLGIVGTEYSTIK